MPKSPKTARATTRKRLNLTSLRDYVRLAAPEPEILTLIGEESVANGTDNLTPRQIDRIIRKGRAQERKR